LLPCPFCGAKGEFDDDGEGGWFIQCSEPTCAASSNIRYPLKEDVKPLLAEQWNRRAASPTPPSMGVTLPSEELRQQIRQILDDEVDPRPNNYSGEWDDGKDRATDAILDLIERKNGRKP